MKHDKSFETFVYESHWLEDQYHRYRAGDSIAAIRAEQADLAEKRADGVPREETRKELKKIQDLLDAVDINMDLFQDSDSGTYHMTKDVESLFNTILRDHNSKTHSDIRRMNFEAVPLKILMQLKMELLDALISVGASGEEIISQLARFNQRTGCPSTLLPHDSSDLVDATVKNLELALAPREEYIDRLSGHDAALAPPLDPADWDNLLDMIYADYEGRVVPLFLSHWKDISLRFQQLRQENSEKLSRAINANPAAARYDGFLQASEKMIEQSSEVQSLDRKIKWQKDQKQRKNVSTLNALERKRESLVLQIEAECRTALGISEEDETAFRNIHETHDKSPQPLLEEALQV